MPAENALDTYLNTQLVQAPSDDQARAWWGIKMRAKRLLEAQPTLRTREQLASRILALLCREELAAA